MKYINRKSMQRLAERTLKKCTRMYWDGIHCNTTSSEHIALCIYFNLPLDDYFVEMARKGKAGYRSSYYFMIGTEKAKQFKFNKYFIDCFMAG